MKKEQGAVFDRRVGALPNITVAIYDHGTQDLSTIYSDNEETPQANPFQTDSLGRWFFYVANGRYDIEFSGSTISTFKLEDVLIEEGGGGISDHGQLTGLADDDHTQYILVNGSRGFSAVVAGVDPTADAHLATKKYVDDEIAEGVGITDHGELTGLADDDHIQYVLVNGSRAFSAVVAGVDPTADPHLATKKYVDDKIPLAHKTSHEDGGGDEISVAGLSGALADKQDANKIQGHSVDETALGNDKVLVYKTSGDKYVYESKTTPGVHAASHQDGGGDEIDLTGLSGALGDKQDANKIQGHVVNEAALGNDKILVYKVSGDQFIYEAKGTPSAHAASHQDGGGDEISVADLSGELADLQKVKDHTHQSSGNGVGGKLDHGLALDGLGDDDHTQYLLANGTRSAAKLIITNGADHYVQIPQLTTTERDDLTPVEGMLIYNSTTDQFERYQASAWGAFGGGGGSGKQRIRIPAACFETRANAGWAEFAQIQGTNFDFGELRYDAQNEVAFTPPFRITNWNAGNVTIRIGFKTNATTGSVTWEAALAGRDTTTPEVWDAAVTTHAFDAKTVPGTAEWIAEAVWTGAVAELANNDAVIMRIKRTDAPGPAIAKLLYAEFEYIEV